MVDALAVRGDEGRVNLRKSFGEVIKTVIAKDVRMGKPTRRKAGIAK